MSEEGKEPSFAETEGEIASSASSSTSIGLSATGVVAPMTTPPKFGGQLPGSTTAVWVGGKPKADWSGSQRTFPMTPLCARGLDPGSEMKSYTKRVSGCEVKFKRDDPEFNLLAFADEALRHMEKHGMDTVFYMNGTKELFTYHTKFTKDEVDKFIKDSFLAVGSAPPKFDEWAKTACDESAEWLLGSLDETLKSSLRPQLVGRPSGPQLWMMIVAEVQSDSLWRCDEMVKQFEKLSLSAFPGENVREFCVKAHSLLIQLERDDQLPNTHLLHIVDCFTACSVLDFKVQWMGRRETVEKFIKESAGKDKATIAKMSNKIHFNELLEAGKQMFTNLQHKWGPAKNVQTQEQALVAKVKALTSKLEEVSQSLKSKQTGGGGTNAGTGKKAGPCWICGGPHKKKDHPKDGGSNNNGGGGSQQPPQNGNDSDKKTGPRSWPAPKEGDSQTKTWEGKQFFFCQKCQKGKGAWNTTHLTAAHDPSKWKGKQGQNNGGNNGETNNNGGGHRATVAQVTDQQLNAWFDDDE